MRTIGKVIFHNGMTHMNLWHWVNNHCVSKNEVDKKATMFFSGLNKQKFFEQVKQRPHWIIAIGKRVFVLEQFQN